MARIRSIKPDFFTSEDIMALSPLARLLYIGAWLEADREGRLAWKPATLKVRYLPSDQCDVAALATELVSRRLIVPYGEGLAFIPTFKTHQVINPREKESKLPEPPSDACARVDDASLRVTHAPSLPSPIPIPIPSPSENGGRRAIDRQPVQARGAFAPGSLPRDHKHHQLCGPMYLICLRPWEYNVLAKAYNEPDEVKTRVILSQFVEVLEKGITPNASIGPFSWVEKEFHTWLKSIGRTAPKIEAKPKVRGVAEILAEQDAAKANGRVS
jgi:hypothetical protein